MNLKRAGFPIAEIVSKSGTSSLKRAPRLGTLYTTMSNARLDAEVIWLCVPDSKIAKIAAEVASAVQWKGKIAFHSGGALTSDELHPLHRRGALVASVHPMMTFVHGAVPLLESVPFAIEGDSKAANAAMRIVRALGGLPFKIKKKNKVLYHAWGTFLSPLLVANLLTAEQVAGAAGIPAAEARKKMLPIVRQTLANYAKLGPENSFSGPIVRGDAEILRRHLNALKRIPEASEVYVALSRAALRYLPARTRKDLKKAMGRRAGGTKQNS
ncbi:MAG: hypothetical protein NVS1B11_00670 [Terriglobales bacterium]